mgnify:CR=1 FL=1
MELPDLFSLAKSAPEPQLAALKTTVSAEISGAAHVDQAELDRSLALKTALDAVKSEKRADAFALRCWPETFTEYGGAICAPASMMGEGRVTFA